MICREIDPLRACVAQWKHDGLSVGLVPTMGALHEGHLSLVSKARAVCDRVIVSIFVNPKQFNSAEDLQHYPRTEAADTALLDGVDALFIPSTDTMYPPGFSSSVQVAGLATRLEGEHRPGHFNGMATVVLKLFTITGADRAFFGEKDWQQLQIIRHFVRDLDLPVSIMGCPTLRETDGLALSSRNHRLTPEHRRIAPYLHSEMQKAAQEIRSGANVEDTLARARARLATQGFGPIDYLCCCHEGTLQPSRPGDGPLRLMAAAYLGVVRLIDNIAI